MSAQIGKLTIAFFAWFCLASCFALEERPMEELRNLQPADYFEDPVQQALVQAAEQGDPDGLRAALNDGAEINAVGRNGMTPLFWALAKENLDGFKLLLEAGADPNVIVDLPDSFRESQASAMELAAGLENPEYLRSLLKHGGNPSTIVNAEWGIPVLYRAIMNRRIQNVKLLLEYGADINHQDEALKTPLMQAVTARLYEIALLLLREGADPKLQDKWGDTPADIVRQFGDRGIDRRTNDLPAYHEFVAELNSRGLLE